MIEDYRKTLVALDALLKRKHLQRAPDKEIDEIRAEIEEVTEVLRHLQKGVSRYKW